MKNQSQQGSVFPCGKRRKMWYGKFRVWRSDPSTGTWSAKQRTIKIGPKSLLTKSEAETKLRDKIAADNKIASLLPFDLNPKELTLEWFVANRHLPMMSCRAVTKKKTEYEIRRYVLRQFGHLPLNSIGPFELQDHLNTLAIDFSESVVRHAYVNLRSIFNNAVDLEFMTKNPARRLKMPDTRVPDKSTLEPAQILKLLKAIRDPMDGCLFAIGVFCGLRTAETFGLTWECWNDQHLAIRNTAFEGKLSENKLKTADSRALVPIPKRLQPIIKKWHTKCPDTQPQALMFFTEGKGKRRGQQVPFDSTNFMERRIHPIAIRLGIPRRLVTFQVMRRTMGTDLQFHGTLKDAQAALRHKSIKTTANIYMQPVPKSVSAAVDARANAIFDKSPKRRR